MGTEVQSKTRMPSVAAQRYSRRDVLRLLAGSAAILPLWGAVGCQPAPQAPSGAGEVSTSATSAPPAEQVTINLWCPAGQRFGDANAGIIPTFEEAHPNIKVNLITTSVGEYFPKLATEIGADTTSYDLFQSIPTFVIAFAQGDKIIDLDRYLTEEYEADLDADIPSNYYDLFKYEGKIYGIPNDTNVQWSFYREDLLEQAGVDLPEKWEDVEGVLAALQKSLQSDSVYAYTASLRRGEYAGAHFSTIFWSYGGEWWDPDFNPTINNDIGRKTLEIMLSHMPYADPGSINATEDDTINAMASGIAAYAPILWGNSALTNPEISQYAEQMGTAVPPAGGSHQAAPMIGGLAYMIPSGAPNKDAAWEYIRFATSSQIMEEWVKHTGQPARLSALEDPKNVEIAPYFPTLRQVLQQGHPQARIAESFQLLDYLGNQVALALTKELTVDQALESIQSYFVETLKEGGHLS